MRAWLGGVLGVALAVCAGTSASEAADLRVVSASPRGNLSGDEQQRIQIVFSLPVVALAQAEPALAPPAWLTVEPPMAARWRWAGTAELVGEPLAALPGGVGYTVRVARNVRAVTGEALPEDYVYAFATPEPRAVIAAVSSAVLGDTDAGELAESPGAYAAGRDYGRDDLVALVVWNQGVDAASLLQHLHVRVEPRPLPEAAEVLSAAEVDRLRRDDPPAYAAWQRFLEQARGAAPGEVPVIVRPHPEMPERLFAVEPVGGCWPVAARVVVSVDAGVRGLGGGAPGLAAARSFTTPAPFAPLGFVGAQVEGGGAFDPEQVGVRFSATVAWRDLSGLVTLHEAGTASASPARLAPESWRWSWEDEALSLESLALSGGARYELCVTADARDVLGRALGFPWCGRFATGRRPPSFYLVEGDGVVELNGPHLIPLKSRNVTGFSLAQRTVGEEELPGVLRARPTLQGLGDVVPIDSRPDRVMLVPVDLEGALGGSPGVVLSRVQATAVELGCEYDGDQREALRRPRVAVTQVTSLGLTVKASRHEGALVWVTRLADATPVGGAVVTVRDREGAARWSGSSDGAGLCRVPAEVELDEAGVVTARLEKDWAYARLSRYEGHRGWEFNLPVDWSETPPVTGTVWPDRGVVRPGESLHLKAVARRQRDLSLQLVEGTSLTFVVRDPRGEDTAVVSAATDGWGAAEVELPVPATAALGVWTVLAGADYDREARSFAASWSVAGSFRVAEFRRPKMRVSVQVSEDRLAAGDPLRARVEGLLLSGGAMAGAPVRWTVRSRRTSWRPPGRAWDDYELMPRAFADDGDGGEARLVARGDGTLGQDGRAVVQVDRVEADDGWPVRDEVEVEVEDVDRQRSAARASVLVLPGDFLLAVRRPPTFARAADGVDTAVAVVLPDGKAREGIAMRVQLVRRHWESVRRREVSGRYVFESRPVLTVVAEQRVVSVGSPVPIHFDVGDGGEFAVVVRGEDARGNELRAGAAFYVFGEGFTPWRMDQENRIELVPERDVVAAGETARILVKSPWSRATALVTVERSGVIAARVEQLAGTMPVVEIPVEASYAPNVFVSVVLLRGRIEAAADPEMVDPGRPAYRIGMCELKVPASGRRLDVAVRSASPTYRPGREASAEVTVRGADGAPRVASVTVWAVDVGVLELTGYGAPDLMAVFYAERGLGVTTAESRSRLVGRRSYGTKGDAPGGGGGREAAGLQVRRDFRAVAVWRGDVVTDAVGRARIAFPLPDSLTTYRLMAVAMAGAEEFGVGETEFLVTKPVGLEPALPRFLRAGDTARAGVVVRNRTTSDRDVDVTLEVAADGPVGLRGGATRTARVPAGGSAEVGFGLRAVRPGAASLRFAAQAAGEDGERDAMEVALPVMAVLPAETVATFFAVDPVAREVVAVPAAADVFPDSGGLEVRVAPSLLVEAAPGVAWLAAYPYGCAEQVASRILGVTAAMRLGDGFAPASLDGEAPAAWLQAQVDRLLASQQSDGGFSFWPGAAQSVDALSAHVAWALAEARRGGATVDQGALDRATGYLSRLLRREDAPWGRAAAWSVRALAAFALVEAGKAEPAYFQALFDQRRELAPVWGRAVLAATMLAVNPADPRAAALLDEVRNHLVVESRTARLEEASPPWGWVVWWGRLRGTAAAQIGLLAGGADGETTDRLARALVDDLGRGPDRTTQDAAWALQALVRYREAREGAGARGEVVATLAGETMLTAELAGGRSQAASAQVPMVELLRRGEARSDRGIPLEVRLDGSGVAHGAAILWSATRRTDRAALSQGLTVARAFLDAAGASVDTVAAGAEVTLAVTVTVPAGRRFVAVDVPVPAGLEPVDPDLATTARALRDETVNDDTSWWRPGFDHVERHDDRIVLFATTLEPGETRLEIPMRATTPGRFTAAPARAEEMYAPEVFGTTSTGVFEVTPGPR